jgi:hypothetical protein
VTTDAELLAAVDAAFEVTGKGLESWPAPHPDRPPLEEEYSRLTDATKWRILGARAEAWIVALADAGLAVVEPNAAIQWAAAPGTVISRTDRVVPHAAGALPLVVARSRMGDVDDAGVTLGAGDPAVCVTAIPSCGCDACDSGSRRELDELDAHLLGIVTGAFRRLSAGDRKITVIGPGTRSASGPFLDRTVGAVLADPSGWDEVSGASWLHDD